MKDGLIRKLKEWRILHEEDYAKAITSPPARTTIAKVLPMPGLTLLMGHRGKGKSADAHAIAYDFHKRLGVPAVIHLPHAPDKVRAKVKRLLPAWMSIVTSQDKWPKNCVVIFDEASQSAHARRTQSGDAVDLDNLIGVSRQRNQLIIFISHHSRKLDVNVVHEVDQIHWKMPSYAHQLFERDELADFTMKAFDFFRGLRSGVLYRECRSPNVSGAVPGYGIPYNLVY